MKAAIIIPARYGSTRFPGKSLALIARRPMIQWVWEAARRCRHAQAVVVATDDPRIAEVAAKFGADVAMTKKSHRSGTDRMAEVAQKLAADLYVNVQGDEPLLAAEAVDALILDLQKHSSAGIGTLAHRIDSADEWRSRDVVKVVRNRRGEALYFSRSPIPHVADFQRSANLLRHVGIYAFRASALAAFVSFRPSELEKAEKLEQLRALENGLTIRVIETKYRCLGVDTPADLARVEPLLAARLSPKNRRRAT